MPGSRIVSLRRETINGRDAAPPAMNILARILGAVAITAQIAAAAGRTFDIGPVAATADIATYARLAAGKEPGEKPKPLYLRGADAKPQAGFILPRQDRDPPQGHGSEKQGRNPQKRGSGEKES